MTGIMPPPEAVSKVSETVTFCKLLQSLEIDFLSALLREKIRLIGQSSFHDDNILLESETFYFYWIALFLVETGYSHFLNNCFNFNTFCK